MAAPLKYDELVEKYNSDASTKVLDAGEKKSIQVELLDVMMNDKYKPKLVHENGRLKVVVETDANGIKIDPPFPNPKVVLLDAPQTKHHDSTVEARGFHPQGIPTSFPPSKHDQAKGRTGDKPSVVFGPDDRVVFHDTSSPWRISGKIETAVGRGSGCMIGSRHVLTASHCVNWAADGSAGWIKFTPGYYDGSGPWGTFWASTIYAYRKNPSTLTDDQTAFDYAVLVLDRRIGDTVGYAGAKEFANSWVNTVKWVFIGYPNDLTGTERPAYQNNVVITSKRDFAFNGHVGSVLGHFSDVTYGMFGGPLWGTWAGEPGPSVVGVASTREGPPIAVPDGSTNSDNEFAGGKALVDLITQARADAP